VTHPRATAILVAVVLLLGGAYYLVEVRGGAAREAARAVERRLVDFRPDDVREIVIDKRTERVVLQGDGTRWRITAPDQAAADASTVAGLLAFVARLEKVRALDGAGDLEAFGLRQPRIRLSLAMRDGQTLSLALADLNPAATGVYARVEGVPAVFLAPLELTKELGKTPYVEEVRDRTVLAVDPERVRRLAIDRADAHIAVARVAERRWRVERPFAGPGDDGIIRDLLWKLQATRSRAVAPARGDGDHGLDRPHARVTIEADGEAPRILAVVLDGASGRELYARVEGRDEIHVVDAQLLSDLAIEPEALRDRQLLVLDRREAERITIRYPDVALVLERGAEGWKVTTPVQGEALPTLVENLLEVLPNIRYRTMVSARAGDLAVWGLDRPRRVVTVGLRGGRALPDLLVGREEGGEHFVMVAGTQAVYKVDSRLLRVIPDDPADAKRYPLPEQLKRGLDKQRTGPH
jgi:Domain of unknown function (DUF4340)